MVSEDIFKSAAQKFGTPLYLYDEEKILTQLSHLKEATKNVNGEIHYAVKANSSLKILSLLKNAGAKFDTVSGGEIQRVLTAGGSPLDIIFSGTGKTKNEIRLALEKEIRSINIETLDELEIIISLSKEINKTPKIAFRCNPEVAVSTHPYISTGLRENKFGLSVDDIKSACELLKSSPHVKLDGLSCHIGSEIFEIDALKEAYEKVKELAVDLESQGFPLSFIDCGGGFGVSYRTDGAEFNLNEFSKMLTEVFSNSHWKIFFEPGKYLVAESGYLITEILSVKKNQDKIFYIVDAGMNDLIRPSLYEAHHEITVLNHETETQAVDVVGPVCESGCFFAQARELKKAKVGDILIVHTAGAYGMSMASRYNSRCLPAEVLVNKNRGFELVRQRETFEDLIKGELL